MNVAEHTSNDESTHGGGVNPPCTGLTPDALPEVQQPVSAENSPTGVSTRNAPLPKAIQEARRAVRTPHWYALRTTYGREMKAYEYLLKNNVQAYCSISVRVKLIGGKQVKVEKSLLPNILFVYGTEEEVSRYVYDNVNLPYVRFYYRHTHIGSQIQKSPLIVPDQQMKSLRIIASAEGEDVFFSNTDIPKFSTGQRVRITSGTFAGVEGRVARFHGQQRVAVQIDGLLTAVTAYVPKAYLVQLDGDAV